MSLIRTVTFITKPQREALEEEARAQGCSASNILSQALLLYLQAKRLEALK